MVADFYEQLGIARKPQVGAGAEAHQADAFAVGDAIAGFFPADHATGDEPGDLLERRFRPASVARVIMFCSFCVEASGAHGGGKFAGAVIEAGDDAGGGRAVDVHVPDGEEDTDALAGPAGVLFIGDDHHAAVGGGDDGARIGGRLCARGRGKMKSRTGQRRRARPQRSPSAEKRNSAEQQRRNAEVIAFFHHAFRESPQAAKVS